MYKELYDKAIKPINIEGPIKVTEDSHTFSSSKYARKPLNLDEYDYSEEEYFITGTSNIYTGEEYAQIKYENQPYKNRILVRKPQTDKFSGRVFIDIYNASNGYDIEDVWRRAYQYYLEEGHIYIGITSKPINVLSLKNFDYQRYESLNWASPERHPQPSTISPSMSIPGTEEGLFWDMLTQLAYYIKNDQVDFLADYQVNEIYLTGQSQSGIYLNTYLYYFNEIADEIFDGYLNVVGAGVMRDLNQYDNPDRLFSSKEQKLPNNLEKPFILLSSEGDINLFGDMINRDNIIQALQETDEPIRHYELASSPHTDPASPLIPDNKEIVKTKNPAKLLDGEYDYTVNNIQLAYYVNACLEMLHQWSQHNKEAPKNLLIERDKTGKVVTDKYGNGKGGLRNPYVEVPIATYHANALESTQKPDEISTNVNGSMEYFTKDELKELYDSQEDYLTKFKSVVEKQVNNGWLLASDAKRMEDWAIEISNQLFN